ncbi:hypothetical protein RCG17_26150 [Neobacillus sp. PS3-12]|uniref:hypothetical protein n=1 Tax=Neobacillus sp. PS3-12 TaxID=3070677 RepID=UPI0027E00131|nr:hypothetical protein [Neobacillus sp. PS3-12]WML52800.1 hypothetical protein RCG17_26150 [Neobacillus sp. PS3-12]
MGKKLIGILLGLCLLLPSIAMANGNSLQEKCKGTNMDCYEKRSHHMMDKNWKEEMKKKQQLLLAFVNKYTPEKKKEWEAVIKDRNKLIEKWSSPQYAEKRKQWKKIKMAKIEELHKQYEEGKISKEEFLKKVHSGKEMGQWKIYQEIQTSVKNHDDKKTAQLLNQLLEHYKQKNEMMRAALKS